MNYNDLYSLNCGDVDPIALIQNVTCQVEKMMGIYPNVHPGVAEAEYSVVVRDECSPDDLSLQVLLGSSSDDAMRELKRMRAWNERNCDV